MPLLLIVALEVVVATLVLLAGATLARRTWRQRARWSCLDFFAPCAAFVLWGALLEVHEPPKSLSNAGIEPVLLAFAIGGLAVGRVLVGPRLHASTLRVLFLVLSAVSAIALAVLVGPLPE